MPKKRVLTREEKRIIKNYVSVVKYGKHYSVYFRVDHQSFMLVSDLIKVEANWYAHMLAIALERLIKDEKNIK